MNSTGVIPTMIARSRPASVVRTVTPSVWPVSLDDIKAQIRVTSDDEDVLLQSYIEAATEYCQRYQWSQLITGTFVQRQDFFPPSLTAITLYRNPVVSVASVTYIDTNGVTQTMDPTTYVVDNYIVPALIVPAYTRFWPVARWHINDVTVTYDAGFGATAESVPAMTRQAIRMLCAYWWKNRESAGNVGKELEFATTRLLDINSYRTFY